MSSRKRTRDPSSLSDTASTTVPLAGGVSASSDEAPGDVNWPSADRRAASSASPRSSTTPPHQSLPERLKAQPFAARSNASTSFRNVSACNRCRLRKNRCDQNLPACDACAKTNSKCAGFDPFLNREIPRSYVYYLETRNSYLERTLEEKGIPFSTAEEFFSVDKPDADHPVPEDGYTHRKRLEVVMLRADGDNPSKSAAEMEQRKEGVVDAFSQSGLQPASETIQNKVQRATPFTGLSFSRVVFAAMKSSLPQRLAGGTAVPSPLGNMQSMRDSIFGISSKTGVHEAPFPDRDLGLKLADLYFEHANPQIPILHREDFMSMFEGAYNHNNNSRSPKELYMLNIVFAIGAGVILDTSEKQEENELDKPRSSAKKVRRPGHQHQPEEYHAAAMVHMEGLMGAADGRGLEELQAVLLLAAFALLRPVAPGLWYIVGNALRLAVDLGLHYEDGADIRDRLHVSSQVDDDPFAPLGDETDRSEIGRRQWVRDLRRRLWWCVYSFDRLVGTVVGRPFSISDQVVTTEFPSALDDRFITHEGFKQPPSPDYPSYKHVGHHYTRLRLLQSEIVQVLQYQSAQRAHDYRNRDVNPFMHTGLSSPFMHRFTSFRAWRSNIHERLWQWKLSAPTTQESGVKFDPQFLELNYWQAVILLYRQSVTTPAAFTDDMKSVNDGMDSPHSIDFKEDEEEEVIYLRIAEAGQQVLKIYRRLHRLHLVNYTFLATHHLFMAGVSFLYAIWHSKTLRSYLSLDDVDSTLLAASSVLSDLIPKCPPAEACKTAFDRMSRATVQMCLSTTGFGPQAANSTPGRRVGTSFVRERTSTAASSTPAAASASTEKPRSTPNRSTSGTGNSTSAYPMGDPGRLQPNFDMDLGVLLSGRKGSPPVRDYFTSNSMTARLAAKADEQAPASYPSPFHAVAGQHASPGSQTSNPASSVPMAGFPQYVSQPPPQQQQQFSDADSASYVAQPASYDNMSNSIGNLSEMSFLADMPSDYQDQHEQSMLGLTDGDPSNPHLFSIGAMDGSHDWQDGGGGDLFGGWLFGGGAGAGGVGFGGGAEL